MIILACFRRETAIQDSYSVVKLLFLKFLNNILSLFVPEFFQECSFRVWGGGGKYVARCTLAELGKHGPVQFLLKS